MDENLIGMLRAMLAIAGAWWLGLLAFGGIGLSFHRLAGLKIRGAEDCLSSFWVGWALALSALQVWHLFWPVDARATLCFLAVGLLGLAYNFPLLIGACRHALRPLGLFLLCAFLFSVWLANRAMSPLGQYDAGLYHLSVIRWTSSFPIVPGLGNLHGRLAFNSSYYLYMALLDVGPWAHRLYHMAPGLLLLALGLQISFSVLRIIGQSTPPQAPDLVRVGLIPLYVWLLLLGINDTSADLAVLILCIVVYVELARLLLASEPETRQLLGALTTAFLAAAAVTLKLSALAFAVSAALIAVGVLRHAQRVRSLHVPWAWLWWATLLALAVWMGRGIVLSGYPAYPSTLGAVNVDWRVPTEAAREEARWVMSWARAPGEQPDEVLDGWDWLRPWAGRVLGEARFVLAIPLFLAALLGLAAAVRFRRSGRPLMVCLLLVPPLASLIFWFLIAPEPRFVGAAPWLVAAGMLLLALEMWGWSRFRQTASFLLMICVAVTLVMYLTSEKFVDPGPLDGFYPLPTAELEAITLSSRLTIYVPARGDQCWDAPLPCTPNPQPTLRLRVVGDLASGFTISPP